MGERLLCKQEVVGSIPSASRACAGPAVSWREGLGIECWITAEGRVWRLRPEVRVFFVDCESGSGAFWTRRTLRWVLPGCVSGWAGSAGVVRGGFGLGV